MSKSLNNISFIYIAGILFGLISVQVYFGQLLAQSNQPTNMTNTEQTLAQSNQSFFSKKDLFTFSKPQGIWNL